MFFNSSINWALRLSLLVCAFGSIYYAIFEPTQFSVWYATEDGPVEYATAILLFAASLILAVLAWRASGYKRALIGFYAVVFFFGAGEEVSWGQRIFDIESSTFFTENNYQGETNLHNLVVRGTHLTEFLFGTGLAILIMLYLLVLPFVYRRWSWLQKLCDALCAPIPPRHIALLAVLATLLSAWIDLPRQWEVYEFAFSAFVCLIFLNPVNRDTFHI